MRALVLNSGRLTFRDDLADPTPVRGESLVRVLRAGICSTDLALMRGYMNFEGILGHEFVGVALHGSKKGQRVVGEINFSCGDCRLCREGLGRHCPRRSVLGILDRPGCFADFVCVPDPNLMTVPDSVPTDAAVFVEPLAAAFEIGEQMDLQAGMRALIVGDGRLGCLCALVLRRFGLDVTLAGRHPERVERLGPGIRSAPDLLQTDPPSGRGFDLAVEATGKPDVLGRLLPWVRPRGTVVLKTTTEACFPTNLTLAVVNELTLLGSRCGRFAPALSALSDGSIDVLPLVEARFPLERGEEALARAGRGGVLKILLDVEL